MGVIPLKSEFQKFKQNDSTIYCKKLKCHMMTPATCLLRQKRSGLSCVEAGIKLWRFIECIGCKQGKKFASMNNNGAGT